jgi:hypothetical protein
MFPPGEYSFTALVVFPTLRIVAAQARPKLGRRRSAYDPFRAFQKALKTLGRTVALK